MKKHIKTVIDIAMLTLFLYLMHYHPGMGLRLHAIVGITLCVLFILHHFLNVKWYTVLFRGKYRFRRALLTVSDFLLLAAMLGIMISSFMISGLVFPISFLPAAFYWRDIHVLSTAWGFLLMSFHLGIHLHGFLSKTEKKMRGAFRYGVYLLELLIFGFGCYGFLQNGLWDDMRMIPQIVPVPSDFLFYAEYIGIIGAVCVAVHYLITAVQICTDVCRKGEKPSG